MFILLNTLTFLCLRTNTTKHIRIFVLASILKTIHKNKGYHFTNEYISICIPKHTYVNVSILFRIKTYYHIYDSNKLL